MGTKEETSFVPETESFPLPRIKQAADGPLYPDFFKDCTIIAPIPSKAGLGDNIFYVLFVEGTGTFSGSAVLTQELLDNAEVVWRLFPFTRMARPGSIIRLHYALVQGGSPEGSPNQEYTVVNFP